MPFSHRTCVSIVGLAPEADMSLAETAGRLYAERGQPAPGLSTA